jgi:hypothetical protein
MRIIMNVGHNSILLTLYVVHYMLDGSLIRKCKALHILRLIIITTTTTFPNFSDQHVNTSRSESGMVCHCRCCHHRDCMLKFKVS